MLTINLDSPNVFDAILENSLPEGQDASIVVKPKATQGGNPAVMMTFTVQLPNGEPATAQTVVTAREFLAAAVAIRARYGDLE